jgi:signal-transduction protein with cAMP-binding, CBS, and nucleotidyltransferase domain
MSPRAAWRLESLGFTDVYVYLPGKADWGAMGLPLEGMLAGEVRIGDVAVEVPTCGLREPVGEVRLRAEAAGWKVAVAVNDLGEVLGVLRRRALESDPNTPAEQAMAPGPSTYRPNVWAHEMYHRMLDRDINGAIVTRSDGTLIGMVRRKDLELALDQHEEPDASAHDDEG